jgi:hypothetical protein
MTELSEHTTPIAADVPAEEPGTRDEFRRRLLGLALEADRCEEITQSKLTELAAMVGMKPRDVERLLSSAGLDKA